MASSTGKILVNGEWISLPAGNSVPLVMDGTQPVVIGKLVFSDGHTEPCAIKPFSHKLTIDAKAVRARKAEAMAAFATYVDKKVDLLYQGILLDMDVAFDPRVLYDDLRGGKFLDVTTVHSNYTWPHTTVLAIREKLVARLQNDGFTVQPCMCNEIPCTLADSLMITIL